MFLNLEKYLNETFEPQSEERKSGCVDLFQLDLSVLEKSIQNDFVCRNENQS